MYHSPFSTVTKFYMPDGKGIYALPHSNEAPSGWGDPRTTPQGEKIVPGTVGGSAPYVLIDNAYKPVASKYVQKSGCISWWGPLIDPAHPEKGRRVLSYHGPKLRLFRETGFIYGSSSDHQEIYYRGGYAGIAPGPVLGACLREMPYLDPVAGATTNVWWIIVVCWEAGIDRFYRKRFTNWVSPDRMTGELRASMSARFNAETAPFGWQDLGTYAQTLDTYAADTPWFFNESGTEACAMRVQKITFSNGFEDVTEDCFYRLAATVGETYVQVSKVGNSPAMTYTEEWQKTRVPEYISTDSNGNHHSWREDHIHLLLRLEGGQEVCCDYVGDALTVGKMMYQCARLHSGYFTLGTDPAVYFGDVNPQGTNQSNKDQYIGPLPKPPGYLPEEGDHYYTTWIDIQQQIRLVFEGGSDLVIVMHQYTTGTSDEWAGHPKQDSNPWLYYYNLHTRYLVGGFDVRRLFTAARDTNRYALHVSGYQHTQNEKEDIAVYTEDNYAGEKLHAASTPSIGYIQLGFDRYQVQNDLAADFSITLSRTSYIGKWPDDNFYGNTQEPGSKAFYALDTLGMTGEGWPTIPDLLWGEASQSVLGNAIQTERQKWAVSMKVQPLYAGGDPVVLSRTSNGSTVESIVGYGTSFNPLGVC